jgi:hypothetical protein
MKKRSSVSVYLQDEEAEIVILTTYTQADGPINRPYADL